MDWLNLFHKDIILYHLIGQWDHFRQAKVRLSVKMCVHQNCLLVSNLSSIPCLYKDCNSAFFLLDNDVVDPFNNFKLLAWPSDQVILRGLNGSTMISKIWAIRLQESPDSRKIYFAQI